jgi:hypothetical protein
MEWTLVSAFFGLLLSLKGLGVFVLGGGAGWVVRKYAEKRWPNEAALLDAVGTKYGEAAQAKLMEFKNKVSGG